MKLSTFMNLRSRRDKGGLVLALDGESFWFTIFWSMISRVWVTWRSEVWLRESVRYGSSTLYAYKIVSWAHRIEASKQSFEPLFLRTYLADSIFAAVVPPSYPSVFSHPRPLPLGTFDSHILLHHTGHPRWLQSVPINFLSVTCLITNRKNLRVEGRIRAGPAI